MRDQFQICKGFTLLEIIIATSIVAVIAVVLTQTLATTSRSNTKVEILKEVKQNGEFALAVMERMIRNSRRLTSTCSSTATASASLAMENPDGGITTFTCGFDGALTRIASVSPLATDYLTGTNTTLGGVTCAAASLTFTCTGAAGGPTSVSIQFRLAQKGTSPLVFDQASQAFQTTVALRNR